MFSRERRRREQGHPVGLGVAAGWRQFAVRLGPVAVAVTDTPALAQRLDQQGASERRRVLDLEGPQR